MPLATSGRIAVEVPSTSANLASGFDIVAVAHNAFYDRVEVSVVGEGYSKIKLKIEGKYANEVPADAEKNAVTIPVLRFLDVVGEKLNLEIKLHKNIPPGKGLGSSGASSVGGLAGLNRILGEPLEYRDLLDIAAEGERLVAGSKHYDNVAASLLGGFVMVDMDDSGSLKDVYKISNGEGFRFLLIIPEIDLPKHKTKYSRGLIPQEVPLRNHIRNSIYLSLLIYGIATGKPEIAGKGFNDVIVEPAREVLVPLYRIVKKEILKAGGYGVAISGAGPSIIALVDPGSIEPIEGRVHEIYRKHGYRVRTIRCRPSRGAIDLAKP